MTPASLKWALRSIGRRRTAPVISGYLYRCQWNAVATSGTVVVIALKCHYRYARLGTTLGTSYESFTSCHVDLSFLSQAVPRPEKVLLPKRIQGSGLICPRCV
jgi:hypothetical protein